MSAYAQEMVLVHNQDTTYFIEQPMLDNITVTAKRIVPPSGLDQLISNSELNTTVSGLTKDLQRDLPAMIRIYTPQGVPLLTKYATNYSITSTIPDSVIELAVREPSAKYPNPDAPIVINPAYDQRSSLSLSPFHQTITFGSEPSHRISSSIGLSHSSAPDILRDLIPALNTYSTTYGGYGALRGRFSGITTEVIFHHSQTANTYGELFNIEKLEENEEGTTLLVHSEIPMGKQTLLMGFAHQSGWEERFTIDQNSSYRVFNNIDAKSYTAALNRNSTELRLNLHNLHRVYSYGSGDIIQMQRLETLLTHTHEISPTANLTLETRFDHKDQEPSLSIELLRTRKNVRFNFNAARLYDAVGSEGLNNLMSSVQLVPHPWQTTYARFGTGFNLGRVSFNTSITAKQARLGWYGSSADTRGWIARLGADGMFYNNNSDRFFMAWKVEGIARNLILDLDHVEQPMPGPARLEGHTALEAFANKMKFTIQSNIFIDRQIRVAQDISGGLGPQYFLSFTTSRTMGPVQLEAKVINSLALLGQKNRILGHYNEDSGMQFISAPPFMNLTLGINF